MSITRPVIRWHGGKWRLASWIMSFFPEHRVYVEPFGGAGSVLMQKPRSYAEVYNDLDGEIVNLFRVLRDQGEELRQKLAITPFSREEFEASYIPSDNPVEQARRTVIRCQQGFSPVSGRTGFRCDVGRTGTIPAHDWAGYEHALPEIVSRLAGVVIENKPAKDVMQRSDSDETLHYLDPPYVPDTRTRTSSYNHDMTADQHRLLLETAMGLKGAVVISGYVSGMYEQMLSGWRRIDRESLADCAGKRVESIWLNQRAADGLSQKDLFAEDWS